MSFEAASYSSDGNGFIYAPSAELVVPPMDLTGFEALKDQLIEAPNDSRVARLYEHYVLGVDKSSTGLVELALAKRIFQHKAEQNPSERIPVAIVMKNKDIVKALVMRLDGSKGARHRMQIESRLWPPDSNIHFDKYVTLNLGMLPMYGSEPSLFWGKGSVQPVRSNSDWSQGAPFDFVGYGLQDGSYVPSKRIASVVAIGSMVEPLLSQNGMRDLYAAWEQLPNPLMQRQMIRIARER